MHIEEIITRFQGAKKIGDKSYQCRCSSHNDDKASLTITEEDNKILMHCHAGCDTLNILNSVGLTEKDMFNNVKEKPQLVVEYIYRDENGNPLYKVMRFEPKNFIQARYNNGEWVYKMAGVRYVLYNLPNVIKSEEVYFVEGEKDADNLNKIGLTATTSVSGAASYKKRAAEYAESLRDKVVYIVPDNDKSGYSYADDIKKSLEGIAKEIKVLKLADEIKDLPEKGDVSDVIMKYGKDKTLEILDKLKQDKVEIVEKQKKKDGVEYFEDIEISRDTLFTEELMEKLYRYELQEPEKFYQFYSMIKIYCTSTRTTGFDKMYKIYKDSKQTKYVYQANSLIFPELTEKVYNSDRYEVTPEGFIFEIIPNVGKILVCYHPILPFEKYVNLEDGSEKIKLAFFKNNKWNTMIVDKSTISSNQSIIKLSDFGVSVTSENAKYLVKYLAEIENLNRDIIKTNTSISRLGWFGDILAPYDETYEFDNEKDMPYLKEKFGESGKLEDWIEFFRERRKHSIISRMVLASGVASILLKRIKQSGFTLHIWGESEYGKTVACMVGQSIFGNPSQNDNKGIGINFNLTNAGLEYRLNLYNNIPLFINEMQHQKDAKDYDKMLFLISEGKGKSRSTKLGGIAKENSWNNVVITNGEKNIIKDNSNAGAYNRCISCEITEYSYENLSEVADFVKENYGTPIREILKHLDEYDCKTIYKNILSTLEDQDITNKQKMLEAIIMLGDKILTDIIFKDSYYLTKEDFENKTVKKKDVATEERAYEVAKDWFVSEQRHFLNPYTQNMENEDIKVEIYGRKMKDGYVAIIPNVLRKVLTENGYDFNEVLNAWKRKNYVKHEKNRNTLTVQINGANTKCIALNISKDLENEEEEQEWAELDEIEMPF